MPQMAPMMWTTIFYFTIFMFILTSVKLYFSKSLDPKSPESDLMSNAGIQAHKSWKW